MAEKTAKELLAEIAELQIKLAHSEQAKTEAQQMATAMAEASAFSGNAEEQPTGKTVTRKTCLNPAVRDAKEHKWQEVKEPTYYYTVEIPEGAGNNLMTNGMEYFHGQTYEVDRYTLSDLKSRVARTWDHEKSIHSENENAYRKPSAVHLKSKAAMSAGY